MVDELNESPQDQDIDDEGTTEEAAPSPEEVAKEYLKAQGIDPDAFDFKKAAKLSDWERNLNKKSSELGSIAKQLETAKPKAAEPDTSDFAPEDLVNLKKALKAVGLDPDLVNTSLSFARQSVEEQRSDIAADFFAKNDEIASEDIIRVMYEDGIDLDAITPARLKRELGKAYKLVKADRLDVDSLVEQKVAERLAKLGQDGEEIVEVKKGRGSRGGHKTINDVLEDPNVDFFAKLNAAAKMDLSNM